MAQNQHIKKKMLQKMIDSIIWNRLNMKGFNIIMKKKRIRDFLTNNAVVIFIVLVTGLFYLLNPSFIYKYKGKLESNYRELFCSDCFLKVYCSNHEEAGTGVAI